jgi:hypothetical protein
MIQPNIQAMTDMELTEACKAVVDLQSGVTEWQALLGDEVQKRKLIPFMRRRTDQP